MDATVPQSQAPQPQKKILIETGDIDFVAMRFEKAHQRPVLDAALVECKPAEADPLPYSEWRNMKRLSQLVLRVSILEPGAHVASPKPQIHRSSCTPQFSGDVGNCKFSRALKEEILFFLRPWLLPAGQFQFAGAFLDLVFAQPEIELLDALDSSSKLRWPSGRAGLQDFIEMRIPSWLEVNVWNVART